MRRVLALSIAPGEVRGVLLEDGSAVELVLERDEMGSLVRAVFFVRIKRVMPKLPGAFVDLGSGRTAFLPGERLPGGATMVEGAGLLVKVVKDAFADKVAEVTATLDFAGSFIVWTPLRPGIAVSRRIAPAERARLLELVTPMVEPGDGLVLRSHAAGIGQAELAEDLDRLRRGYVALLEAAARAGSPCRLDPVEDAIGRITANFGHDLEAVLTDDRGSVARLRQGAIDPERVIFEPAFDFTDRHGITDAFDEALAVCLTLDGGGEIIIENTAAFTAFDVNSASAGAGRGGAAAAILAVNIAAARAVARQLRLRNIGGAVVVDFISMGPREHRRQVEQAFAEAAAHDPMRIELHGWTRLGHLELTRKRSGASIADRLLITGTLRRRKTPTTIGLELVRALASIPFRPEPIEIRVNGGVAAELDGALAAIFKTAAERTGRRVTVTIDKGRDAETFDIGGA